MHLLALGAFWPEVDIPKRKLRSAGLNAPFGARCFLAYRMQVTKVLNDVQS